MRLSGDYALHVAAREGYRDVVAQLLAWGAEVDVENRIGSTPLFTAVSHNQLSVVRQLLNAGACLATRNTKGTTVLHVAVCAGEIEMVKCLLEAGAGALVHEPNVFGMTPLHYAAKSKPLQDLLSSFHSSNISSGLYTNEPLDGSSTWVCSNDEFGTSSSPTASIISPD